MRAGEKKKSGQGTSFKTTHEGEMPCGHCPDKISPGRDCMTVIKRSKGIGQAGDRNKQAKSEIRSRRDTKPEVACKDKRDDWEGQVFAHILRHKQIKFKERAGSGCCPPWTWVFNYNKTSLRERTSCLLLAVRGSDPLAQGHMILMHCKVIKSQGYCITSLYRPFSSSTIHLLACLWSQPDFAPFL
eukprot:1143981-Pelagomonas_calceolata.AAC.3